MKRIVNYTDYYDEFALKKICHFFLSTCSLDPTGTKTTLCVCNSGAFFPTVIMLRSSESKGSRMVESFNSSTTKSGIRKSNLPTIVKKGLKYSKSREKS